jgi:hypothetical protein
MAVGADSKLPVPLTEPFDKPALDPAWVVDVSEGNSIDIADAALSIRAAMNTYAHINGRWAWTTSGHLARSSPRRRLLGHVPFHLLDSGQTGANWALFIVTGAVLRAGID